MSSTTPKPKIAILDDYQGIALQHFTSLSSFQIDSFPDTLPTYDAPSTSSATQKQLIDRLKPYTIISSMRERTPFPASLLSELPNLKLLCTTGMRNRGIDLDACKSHNIIVTGTKGGSHWTPQKPTMEKTIKRDGGPDSTTQHCVSLILALARGIADDDKTIKSGGWQTAFATGLNGKTLGVLGLGRLGGNVAKIMWESFGMGVIAWSPNLTQEIADEKAKKLGLRGEDGEAGGVIRVVSKEELFREADVLSLHVVMSERSRRIVSKEDLERMKGDAFFVNTSRAGLVDEGALLEVAQEGKIRGVALDVFWEEPLSQESKWRSVGKGKTRLLLSPHMGYVEEDTLHGWYKEQADIIKRWRTGEELFNLMT